MTHRLAIIGCAVVLSAAAPKAAAVTPTQNSDAFDLAAAFAPSPSPATVSGQFVEVSDSSQIGTFGNGSSTIGFESGIILSTGNMTQIGIEAVSPLSTDFGGSPTVSTADLVNAIPGLTGNFSDTARLSLEVTPGITANFVNFSLGYMTSEISPSDRFGIFIDGAFYGLINGEILDQAHPWIAASAPNIGLNQAFYQDGNPLNSPFATVSIEIPNPGSSFAVDFVLADVFGGNSDTAVFLGDFSVSEIALGTVVVPEPSTFGLLALAAIGLGIWRIRRLQRIA